MTGESTAAAQASTMAPIVMPEDRLPWPATIVAGAQHVIAMFGATVLGPLLMGFDPNVCVLFSGVGTLIFFFAVGGKVPSFLGSSFSFIAAVTAATAYAGSGPNPNVATALGGVIACGALYALIGAIVLATGAGWLEKVMPPVVTGAVVAAIGLNLARVAVGQVSADPTATGFGLLTIVLVAVAAVALPGFLSRIPILIGGGVAYLIYLAVANGAGAAPPIDFTDISSAAWFGLPSFTAPVFDPRAIALIAPVAIVLVAENLGHVRAIGAMIGRNLDPYLGRAFIGDGIATMVSGAGGGVGVTTYAENMGVMSLTRNFSSATFLVAGGIAILLGLSPKFGALIHTIPGPVIGGLSFVVFGLIAATAGRIWVDAKVDFSLPKNLLVVGVALVMGAGDLTVSIGDFPFGGIAMTTFSALGLYHLLGLFQRLRPAG
jgi:putative pyrimidine permease RutG